MDINELVLYNSDDYKKYRPLVLVELFLMPNTYGAKEKLLVSREFLPEKIRIYNNDEYYAFEYTSPSQEEMKNVADLILNDALRSKYQNIRTQLTLFPSDKDKNFSIIVGDIFFYNPVPGSSIFNIYLLPENIIMKTDTYQDMDKDKINGYLTRNELSVKEASFIDSIEALQHMNGYFPEETKKKFFSQIFAKPTSTKVDNKFILSPTEQKIFNMEALKIVTGSAAPEKELEDLIGLDNVKREIVKLKAKLQYRKNRIERGIEDDSVTNLHMCFLGSPGTGKTTVARIMTGLLYNMGYIKENKCIEVGANELKGGYTGQTSIKTKAILRNAKNKILFIDEAYSLFDKNGGYGQEALDVIIKEMEDNKDNLIVIFAGYKKEMEDFLNMNDGLRSRINRYIYFDNYSTTEMGQIFAGFLKNKKLYIDKEALEKSLILFKNAGLKNRFSNARFARNLLEKVEEEHAFNVRNEKSTQRRDTITKEDISTDIVRELLTQSM